MIVIVIHNTHSEKYITEKPYINIKQYGWSPRFKMNTVTVHSEVMWVHGEGNALTT